MPSPIGYLTGAEMDQLGSAMRSSLTEVTSDTVRKMILDRFGVEYKRATSSTRIMRQLGWRIRWRCEGNARRSTRLPRKSRYGVRRNQAIDNLERGDSDAADIAIQRGVSTTTVKRWAKDAKDGAGNLLQRRTGIARFISDDQLVLMDKALRSRQDPVNYNVVRKMLIDMFGIRYKSDEAMGMILRSLGWRKRWRYEGKEHEAYNTTTRDSGHKRQSAMAKTDHAVSLQVVKSDGNIMVVDIPKMDESEWKFFLETLDRYKAVIVRAATKKVDPEVDQ